jgi:hypothetical protein
MKDPRTPDTQADQSMPDVAYAHRHPQNIGDSAGVNPRATSSMPCSEDDAQTWADSPEYHDRTDITEGGTRK